MALLTDEEQTWVDAYHMRVRNEIGPLVDGAAREWLTAVTAPLGV
jgi:Xaa-Pro aminopeptidase